VTHLESSRGDACGKVILFGEHAVVYGSPAIAAGVERAAHASAMRSTALSSSLRIADREVIADADAKDDLGRALHALLSVPPALPPLAIEAKSELPAGGGLGSSAALAVAISRAVQAFAEANERDPDAVSLERAAAWERVFHGNPSGIDATAAARGGIFRYTRANGATPLHPAKDIVLCVGFTGTPSSTREMVELIAARMAKDPQLVNRSMGAIQSIVDAAASAIEAGDHSILGPLMNWNQHVLSGLMVSTSELEELCEVARSNYALGAKLTGGGGGGSVIALVEPAFSANGGHEHEHETMRAQRIVDAWRRANPRYDGFVTRIRADKRASSSEGEAP
jgi:mevalonate kinase